MSRPVKIVCDGCGRQKEEANHWWLIGVDPDADSFLVAVFRADQHTPEDFNQGGEYQGLEWFDFCGETCALKFISEQMGKHGEETV